MGGTDNNHHEGVIPGVLRYIKENVFHEGQIRRLDQHPPTTSKFGLLDKPASNRKNRRKTRSYCGPCAPLALVIDHMQERVRVLSANCQASFHEAPLPQPNPRRHEPKESGDGGRAFRKNFECLLHMRGPAGSQSLDLGGAVLT
jgi:hypothetical protein